MYFVHDVMHKKQLNLMIFEIIEKYDLKVVEENTIVQWMHAATTTYIYFWFFQD